MQLEQSAVDLVDDDDGLDTLAKSLTQDSLGLHAHTFDAVDNDESAVGDTESGCDLGREIDVTGRVDQVDQELVARRPFVGCPSDHPHLANAQYREMAVDLMVIHRSCSSWRVSVNRLRMLGQHLYYVTFKSVTYASPAFAAEMIPARWTRESVNVDFPWSTWAITLMFLI